MNIWFLILIIFGAMDLGLSIGKHREPRSDYNGWITFFAGIIEVFLIIMAIRNGGF